MSTLRYKSSDRSRRSRRSRGSQLDYVEGHGTGTKLGDPLEIAALTEVLGQEILGASMCFVSLLHIWHIAASEKLDPSGSCCDFRPVRRAGLCLAL